MKATLAVCLALAVWLGSCTSTNPASLTRLDPAYRDRRLPEITFETAFGWISDSPYGPSVSCSSPRGFELAPIAQFPFRLSLRNRVFTILGAQTAGEMQSVVDGAPLGTSRVYAYVGVHRLMDDRGHSLLRNEGIELIDYLPHFAYYAAIERDLGFTGYRAMKAAGLAWVELIEPGDRIGGGLSAQLRGAGGSQQNAYKIYLHDAAEPALRISLRSLGAARREHALWEFSGTPSEALRFIQEPGVRTVELAPDPAWQTGHFGLVHTGSDLAQVFDQGDSSAGVDPSYSGRTGKGVRIGISDNYAVILGLVDFDEDATVGGSAGTSRIVVPPSASLSSSIHATFAALIAAGNGVSSDFPGFISSRPNRGHAPRASIGSYGPLHDYFDDYWSAFGPAGEMDLVGHAYVLGGTTLYSESIGRVDQVIRGDAVYEADDGESHEIPARMSCFPAGNNGVEGLSNVPVGSHLGYWSILSPAKNSLTVGAIDTSEGAVSPFSSLGPTVDGRIKPDLVAPGAEKACDDGTKYSPCGLISPIYAALSPSLNAWGTSFSSPGAAGVAALVLESLREVVGSADGADPFHPLPATMKAILVATASEVVTVHPSVTFDKGNTIAYPEGAQPPPVFTGPDFASGFGAINAKGAVDLASESSQWLEGEVAFSDPYRIYEIEVGPGTASLTVALAWDDLAASPQSGKTTPRLMNDLDLVLIDPAGDPVLPLVPPMPTAVRTEKQIDGDVLDTVTTADFSKAEPGVDSCNNVERVRVPTPMEGTWAVIVELRQLPLIVDQSFGLASTHGIKLPLGRVTSMHEPFWRLSNYEGLERIPIDVTPDGSARVDMQQGALRMQDLLNQIPVLTPVPPGDPDALIWSIRGLEAGMRLAVFDSLGNLHAEIVGGAAAKLELPALAYGKELCIVLADEYGLPVSSEIRSSVSIQFVPQLR